MRSPAEILALTVETAHIKASRPFVQEGLLAFMAGAFIAFASEGSTMAAYNFLADPDRYGLGRTLAGAVFGTGLMLVLVAGGELFTGNCLMVAGVLDRRITARRMLVNWLVVYLGNFLGSVFIAWLMSFSGLFGAGGGLPGGVTIRIARAKCALPFRAAFVLGFLCNWLVCLAVWAASAARDVTGKLLSCFFVIGLFITSGFEHSVANMYYIPAGLFALNDPVLRAAANIADAAPLSWYGFLVKNLFPVTLGNIAGGGFMVGFLYWLALRRARLSGGAKTP
jgi:formate/nitrite transporter